MVYYVAISIDGFICGVDGDINGLVDKGNGVTTCLDDLKEYEPVIMGRKTYVIIYQYYK
ncbi:hypothetical protein [Maribacter sp. ACAM166]|uniref:hypothetical protein n=1 Tax=Maribacter sp. ACAM166 TaxID=2508996 RepID=UPI0014857FA9|nr:hypothetical protein [Maribacter sp. ACAM166]